MCYFCDHPARHIGTSLWWKESFYLSRKWFEWLVHYEHSVAWPRKNQPVSNEQRFKKKKNTYTDWNTDQTVTMSWPNFTCCFNAVCFSVGNMFTQPGPSPPSIWLSCLDFKPHCSPPHPLPSERREPLCPLHSSTQRKPHRCSGPYMSVIPSCSGMYQRSLCLRHSLHNFAENRNTFLFWKASSFTLHHDQMMHLHRFTKRIEISVCNFPKLYHRIRSRW